MHEARIARVVPVHDDEGFVVEDFTVPVFTRMSRTHLAFGIDELRKAARKLLRRENAERIADGRDPVSYRIAFQIHNGLAGTAHRRTFSHIEEVY